MNNETVEARAARLGAAVDELHQAQLHLQMALVWLGYEEPPAAGVLQAQEALKGVARARAEIPVQETPRWVVSDEPRLQTR